LILFDFAKISIGQVSVLGTNLVIGNPDVVHGFMWVSWIYFFVRYWQFIAEKEDLEIISSFQSKKESLIRSKIQTIIERKATTENRSYVNYFSNPIERKGFVWKTSLQVIDSNSGSVAAAGDLKIPIFTVIKCFVFSLIHISIFRPKITEYVLPFILAMAAPIVSVLT